MSVLFLLPRTSLRLNSPLRSCVLPRAAPFFMHLQSVHQDSHNARSWSPAGGLPGSAFAMHVLLQASFPTVQVCLRKAGQREMAGKRHLNINRSFHVSLHPGSPSRESQYVPTGEILENRVIQRREGGPRSRTVTWIRVQRRGALMNLKGEGNGDLNGSHRANFQGLL